MAPTLSLPALWLVAVLLAVSVATLTSGQCDEGRFGPGCGHLCHCVDGSACDVISGVCAEGCEEGYSGPWCQRRNVALGARVEVYRRGRLQSTRGNTVDGNDQTCDLIFTNEDTILKVTLNSTIFASNIVVNMPYVLGYNTGSYVEIFSADSACGSHMLTRKKHMLRSGCDLLTDSFIFDFHLVFEVSICEVSVFVCEPGFHDDVCDQLCGHCSNADCNQKTGICAEGCESGYTGSLCNQTCKQGTYGENCQNKCGHCRSGSACDLVNGSCAQGCDAGYIGKICNQTCAQGTYGYKCAKICGHCNATNYCDPENGTCTQGCKVGYTGNECKNICDPGRYGHKCSQKCGHCVDGSACDPFSGSCPAGCDAGYSGEGCQDECTHGTYGVNCTSVGGHCRQNVTCDYITGSCPDGCEAGYAGEECGQKCYRETFGVNCSQTCPPCDLGMTCHHVTGTCPAMTDREDTGLGTGMGAGVGAGVCLALVGGVVCVWCLLRKRGRRLKKKATELHDESSMYLTPIPSQAVTMGTKNDDSQNANSGLSQFAQNIDNPYDEIESPNEDM